MGRRGGARRSPGLIAHTRQGLTTSRRAWAAIVVDSRASAARGCALLTILKLATSKLENAKLTNDERRTTNRGQ